MKNMSLHSWVAASMLPLVLIASTTVCYSAAQPPETDKAAAVQRKAVVEYAFAEDAARLCRRILSYQGKADDGEIKAFSSELVRLSERIRLLEAGYVKACTQESDGKPLGELSRNLLEEISAVKEKAEAKLKALAPDALYAWPRALDEPRLDAAGKPNRILTGWWGTAKLDEHLKYLKEAGFSFDYFLEAQERQPTKAGDPLQSGHMPLLKKQGIKAVCHSNLLGNSCMLPMPRWWVDQNKDNPELCEYTADGICPMTVAKDWRAQCNLRHPAVRQEVARHLEAFSENCRRSPGDAPLAYLMGCEMSMVKAGNYVEIGYSPLAKKDFIETLRRKYQTIDKLNSLWGSAYAAFDAVEPPPDFTKRDEKTNVGLVFEFEQFRKDTLAAWAELAKQHSPAPVALGPHVKPALGFNGRINGGFDAVKLARAVDIIEGHDTDMDVTVDIYISSLARLLGKRVAAFEWYPPFPEGYKSRVTDERILHNACRRNTWRAAMWDKDMITFWSTTYSGVEQKNDYFKEWNHVFLDPTTGQRLLRYYAASIPLLQKKLHRFSEVLLNTTILPDRVAVLQPSVSAISAWPEGTVCKEGFKTLGILHEAHYSPMVIPEELLLDGTTTLKGYDALIIPYGVCFPKNLSEIILAWTTKGGSVISLGPPGLLNEYGRPLASGMTQVVFPGVDFTYGGSGFNGGSDDNQWLWKLSKKDAAASPATVNEPSLTAPYGKGRIMVFTKMLNVEEMTRQLMPLVSEKTPRRIVTVNDPDCELVIREGGGKRYACVLNRHTAQAKTFTLTFRDPLSKIVDLEAATDVPKKSDGETTTAAIPLDPGEFAILRLEEKRSWYDLF